MSHVTNPQKGPCRRVDFRGLGPYSNPKAPSLATVQNATCVKIISLFAATAQCQVVFFVCVFYVYDINVYIYYESAWLYM